MKRHGVSIYSSPSFPAFLTHYCGILLLGKPQTPIHVAFGLQVSPGTSGLRVAQSYLVFHDLNSLKERVLGSEDSEVQDKRRGC